MKAIIVDDDLMARESINHLLLKFNDIEVLGLFDSALTAQSFLSNNEVDVVFLDVEMPEFSGLELLANSSNLPEIVLITSNSDYAVEAFEYEVLDFIPKPASLVRINKAIERLRLKNIGSVDKKDMYVKSEGRFVRVLFEDLTTVQTLGDYVTLFMKNGEKLVVHSTLSAMALKLPDSVFMKVHRSYIVNLSFIKDIEDHSLLINKSVIPVSRAYRLELKRKLDLP
jgi:DNA-binding LytR/AlgR family response regulator